MLIPDLLNIVFDQADFLLLTCLRSLNKRKTTYANKYSLLSQYNGFAKDVKHAQNKNGGWFRIRQRQWYHNVRASYYGAMLKAIKYAMTQNVDLNYGFDLVESSIRGNNIETAKFLLSCGVELFNGTVLMICAEAGNIKMVKYLASIGYDITFDGYDGYYALSVSAIHGHYEFVKYLVENCVNIRESNALILAAKHNHFNIAEYLVNMGADINRKDGFGNDALTECLNKNNQNIAKYLVSVGADVHSRVDSLLADCIKNNCVESVKYLTSISASN